MLLTILFILWGFWLAFIIACDLSAIYIYGWPINHKLWLDIIRLSEEGKPEVYKGVLNMGFMPRIIHIPNSVFFSYYIENIGMVCRFSRCHKEIKKIFLRAYKTKPIQAKIISL